MFYDIQSFYKSTEWTSLLTTLKLQRLNSNGDLICEHCGKPLVKAYDIIGHHIEELTLDNVNRAEISLNPNNIALVHFKCHNIIHDRYCKYTRHVYLVYGCPLSGKKTWVQENAGQHDIIISLDRIYASIGANAYYNKSGRIADNAFAVRDCLLDSVKANRGKWVSAYILGGYPYRGERERMMTEFGAEEIYIECDKQTAFDRLTTCTDGRDKKEWAGYIEQWFDRYS